MNLVAGEIILQCDTFQRVVYQDHHLLQLLSRQRSGNQIKILNLLNQQYLTMTPTSTLHEVYVQYHPQVLRYIRWRISNDEDARDLAQDVFLRVLEYAPAQYQSDLRFLVFRIANNVINSYLRRYYVRKEYADDCIAAGSVPTVDILPEIYARDLSALEMKLAASLPMQRRKVFSLRRYQEKTADEIAEMLSLSRRTVDTHLYLAFKTMRTQIKAVI